MVQATRRAGEAIRKTCVARRLEGCFSALAHWATVGTGMASLARRRRRRRVTKAMVGWTAVARWEVLAARKGSALLDRRRLRRLAACVAVWTAAVANEQTDAIQQAGDERQSALTQLRAQHTTLEQMYTSTRQQLTCAMTRCDELGAALERAEERAPLMVGEPAACMLDTPLTWAAYVCPLSIPPSPPKVLCFLPGAALVEIRLVGQDVLCQMRQPRPIGWHASLSGSEKELSGAFVYSRVNLEPSVLDLR